MTSLPVCGCLCGGDPGEKAGGEKSTGSGEKRSEIREDKESRRHDVPPRMWGEAAWTAVFIWPQPGVAEWNQLHNACRQIDPNAGAEGDSQKHPDHQEDDPCDLKHDGHGDHIGDQGTDL